MVDGKEILNELTSKRASIENEFPAIEAEFERIARKKADIEARLSALDIVINEFSATKNLSQNGNSAVNTETQTENSNGAVELEPAIKSRTNGSGRKAGKGRHKSLKGLARKNFSKLPQEFTKHDVVKILKSANRKISSLNENTLSGIMRDLVAKDYARIKSLASGTKAQVYVKIV